MFLLHTIETTKPLLEGTIDPAIQQLFIQYSIHVWIRFIAFRRHVFPDFQMSKRRAWQIINNQKRIFDVSLKVLQRFSGETSLTSAQHGS